MRVTCEHCGKRYNLDADRIKGEKAKVKCPKCKKSITVYKQETVQTEPEPASSLESAATGSPEDALDASLDTGDDFDASFSAEDLEKAFNDLDLDKLEDTGLLDSRSRDEAPAETTLSPPENTGRQETDDTGALVQPGYEDTWNQRTNPNDPFETSQADQEYLETTTLYNQPGENADTDGQAAQTGYYQDYYQSGYQHGEQDRETTRYYSGAAPDQADQGSPYPEDHQGGYQYGEQDPDQTTQYYQHYQQTPIDQGDQAPAYPENQSGGYQYGEQPPQQSAGYYPPRCVVGG